MPEATTYVVAAGITPSGVVHIGNFREVMTVDLVARALRDRGVDVRFIYSWDDFDVFRKVPKDAPAQEMLHENLRRSIADVPDPHGEHDSYAAHNIAAFEGSLEHMAIRPEFIRQSQRYRAGAYAEGIRRALEHQAQIRRILDQHRTEPLPADWLPLAGFCTACGRDDLAFAWPGDWVVNVHCRGCQHQEDVDLRQGGNIKLPWRVDWPMRWHHEGVLFEPGGKDHSSAGGSYDTGKELVAEVYGGVAPQYVAYDFVRVKGRGGKISSSAGEAVTLADCLEVYEPQLLRWVFASYRANTEFQISFDVDVVKLYEDYDRAVRLAHTADDGSKNDKKRQVARRTLELASLDGQAIVPGSQPPVQPPFRTVSGIIQVYDGDVVRARQYFVDAGEISTPTECALLERRAACAWNWACRYAPEEFRYRIRSEPTVCELSADERTALARLVDVLRTNPGITEKQLVGHIKTLFEGTAIGAKEFFPVAYDLLIARPQGPKFTTLVITMGIDRAVELLAASLT